MGKGDPSVRYPIVPSTVVGTFVCMCVFVNRFQRGCFMHVAIRLVGWLKHCLSFSLCV